MARFKYTAVALDGRPLSGETSAPDEASVAAEFGRRGIMIVSLARLKSDESSLFSPSVDKKAVTAFLGELARMLRSGLPLDEALDLTARGLPSGLVRVIEAMRRDILAGSSFVQALERHPRVFPRDIVAMARVADATGDLEGMFRAVAIQREAAQRLTEKITGALRYPAFLILATIGVLVFFLIQVIPNFAGLFADSGKDPGALVTIVLAMSAWLIDNGITLAAVVAAVLLAGFLAWRTPASRGPLVAALLRLPGISGLWMLFRTTRFLGGLSLLAGQGVPVTEALKVLEDVVGSDGRAALVAVGDTVRRGGRLHEALEKAALLPPVAVRMVRIGEDTGELAKVAGEAGALYAHQLEKRLDAIAGLVGPAAILLIAGLIGGLMVTIMSALIGVDQAVL